MTKILHNLATVYEKTIIATIHQPSEEMIQLFHHLFLLCDGNVVYSGDISHLARYLQYVGLEPNVPRSNPIEYTLELLGQNTQRKYLIQSWKEQLSSEWSASHPSLRISTFRPQSPSFLTSTSASSHTTLPTHLKYWICLQRHFLYKLISPHGLLFVLLNNLLAGIFYGLIYYQNGTTLQDSNFLLEPESNTITFNYYAYNLVSIQFSTLLYVLLSQSLHISSSYHMKAYYDHEIASGYISPYLVYLIIMSIDLPMILLSLYFYTILVLNLVNPFGDESVYYGLLLMTGVIGFAISQLMMILSSTPLEAFLYFALVCSLQIIFSGYFIAKDELPSFLTWTVKCSNIYYAMGSMMHNEFHDLMGKQGDIVLYLYGYDSFKLTETYQTLGYYLLVVFFLILVVITLTYFFNVILVISCEEYELLLENEKSGRSLEGRSSRLSSSAHTVITNSVRSSRFGGWKDKDSKGAEDDESRQTNIEITPVTFSSSSQTQNPLQATLLPAASQPLPLPPSGATTTPTPAQPQSSTRFSLLSIRSSHSILPYPRTISFQELLKPHYNRPSFTSSGSHNFFATYLSTHPRESLLLSLNATPLMTASLPAQRQVTLQFRSLSYTVTNFLDGTSTRLLSPMSGVVKPGELCAIMGPTGSGKTTLLNVLAGRATVGRIEGQITVNQRPFLGIQHENKVQDSHTPRYG